MKSFSHTSIHEKLKAKMVYAKLHCMVDNIEELLRINLINVGAK